MFRKILLAGVALLLALAGAPALAQKYPDKQIRLIIPFPPAGTTSILGRFISEHLSPLYGQQIVVDNRPGAGGHLGAELAAHAPPDGYTLMLGTIGIHAAYGLYPKLTYDPAKELTPVIVLVELPLVLAVNPSVPVHTVKEFIDLAKARPGEINFGSAGQGTSTHMTGELFKLMAGVNLTHIPYKGSMPALQDVMGGQIQSMFEQVPTTISQIKAGRLRALGVTSKVRAPSLPDVPPIADTVPGYESTAWFTVAAPAKTPAAIVQKLNADLNGMLADPKVVARFKELGITPVGGSTEFAAKYFASETEKWNRVIKAAGIKAE